MSIIYVPANRNSFWSQVNNGTGLYGLVMQQLVKGLFNGIDKRHEAYIDKQVADREQNRWKGVHGDIANTGTSEETSLHPMENMQFEGDSPQMRQALGQGIKNPLKTYGTNEFEDTANQGLADVAGVWDNAEGYGIKHRTVNNPLTAQHFQNVAAKWGLTPDEMQKVSTYYSQYFKNDADLAEAQQRAAILQGMSEPNDTRGLAALSTIADKDMTNAYNAIHPQMKLDVRNAGDRNDYVVFNPRTGDMTTTQGSPFGISAAKLLDDATKRYIHNSPSGSTRYTQAHVDARHYDDKVNGKPMTDAGYNSARKYGQDLVNQLGTNDAIADQILKQTKDPRRIQAMADGAFGSEKIAEYGVGMEDNPMYGKVPARVMRAINPDYLNPKQSAEAAYYRKQYPKETANMSDVDIAKQFNFYNPAVSYAWH